MRQVSRAVSLAAGAELLTAVAQDLELLAAQDPAWRVLLRRAMRIRGHLHG